MKIMKHKRFDMNVGLFCLVLWGLSACSSGKEEIPTTPVTKPDVPIVIPDSTTTPVSVESILTYAPDLKTIDATTRTAYERKEDRLAFRWADYDRIGIFALATQNIAQVPLTLDGKSGSNAASFKAQTRNLESDKTYIAYYPYNTALTTYVDVRFSYDGQEQVGNASLGHIGSYDVMATTPTQPEGAKLNLEFQHVNAIAQINLTVTDEDSGSLSDSNTFTKITLMSDQKSFPHSATLDISQTPYLLRLNDYSDALSMDLENISVTNSSVVVYICLPPLEMDSFVTTVSMLTSDNEVYQGVLTGISMTAGYVYHYSVTLSKVKASFLDEVEAPSITTATIE
jgi:hypothetical protein